MKRKWWVCVVAGLVLSVVTGSDVMAQGGGRTIPTIDAMFKRYDGNGDGVITKDELPAQAARLLAMWDGDGDGKVTKDEIKAFRKKRGIKAGQPMAGRGRGGQGRGGQGRGGQGRGRGAGVAGSGNNGFLKVPELNEITRLTPGKRGGGRMNSESAFAIVGTPHAVNGKGYCILTDHTDEKYLTPLRKLAKHHSAKIVQVKDLTKLATDSKVFDSVQGQLKEALPKHVAVAPKLNHFRENTLLACWKLFSTIDADPELDVLPGFLVANDEKSFAKLIEKTISYQPIAKENLKPFFVSQVPSNRELRSLQKSGILRKLYGPKTPTVGIYLPSAGNAPKLPGENFWKHEVTTKGNFLKSFPEEASAEFAEANYVVLHGHGIPGMSCSVDNSALAGAKKLDVVVCGSCFSAVPTKSDFPAMRQAPGGFEVAQKGSFVMKAVDSGACVVFGHMRLNAGFAHLYPVLETWNQGESVGLAYQQMINSLIKQGRFTKDQLIFDAKQGLGGRRQPKQNTLLYVVIGDPALVPFKPMK